MKPKVKTFLVCPKCGSNLGGYSNKLDREQKKRENDNKQMNTYWCLQVDKNGYGNFCITYRFRKPSPHWIDQEHRWLKADVLYCIHTQCDYIYPK